MIRDFALGARSLVEGFRLLNSPGLRRYVALPLLINSAIFALLIALAAGQLDALIANLLPALPDWLAWLEWLVWLVFMLVAGVLVFFSFTVVANLIGSPFNGLLAEATERRLTGAVAVAEDGGLAKALREAPRSFMDELRKLGYVVRWAVPLLILFLIPGLNLLAPPLWALFGAWMLALEYIGYPLANHGLDGRAIRARLAARRGLALGFGFAVLGATLIPLLNFLVMPAAVAGATLLWVRHLRPQEAGR